MMYDGLDSALDPEEAKALAELGERLREQRPLPRAAFRGDLRRTLIATRDARPTWLWRRVAASATSGVACLAAALLGLAGLGPLAG